MKAHKFVSNGSVHMYSVVVFCEYCGQVVFHGNNPFHEKFEKVRGSECPNGVEPTKTINSPKEEK